MRIKIRLLIGALFIGAAFSVFPVMSQSFDNKNGSMSATQNTSSIKLISYNKKTNMLYGMVSGSYSNIITNNGLNLFVVANGKEVLLDNEDNVKVHDNHFTINLDKYPSSIINKYLNSEIKESVSLYVRIGTENQVKSDSINL
ncbi:hypothetical protein [Pediococcus argentinicus]|uniref:hypothetical protein n=1 Tax=Pediococcus argentinicus TaxID=480391 RepID=UPI00070F4100|nr:hypothetical protein [Pediococcus argentinicus]NKZ23165.1 hypothetical protein [Pediococcus argentinicus]GEP20349.1 hypothetical protein LSA03_17330 [Pediococcus argentinicus]